MQAGLSQRSEKWMPRQDKEEGGRARQLRRDTRHAQEDGHKQSGENQQVREGSNHVWTHQDHRCQGGPGSGYPRRKRQGRIYIEKVFIYHEYLCISKIICLGNFFKDFNFGNFYKNDRTGRYTRVHL